MLSVRLDTNMENEIKRLAQNKQIPKSKIIKDALVYYFNALKEDSQQKSCYELGRDLFGKYESGTDHLSSTYKQKLKEKIDAKNAHR